MAEDDGSENAHARLAERLEQLERVLQANTQRLHAIEQHLRLDQTQSPPRVEQRRPLYESIVDEREQPAPPVVCARGRSSTCGASAAGASSRSSTIDS